MKRCPKCKQEKPVAEFWRNRKRVDGLQRICKACQKPIQSRSNKLHRETRNANNRKWSRKNGYAIQKRKWRELADYKLRASLNRFRDDVTPEMIVAYRRRIVVARSARAMKYMTYGHAQPRLPA